MLPKVITLIKENMTAYLDNVQMKRLELVLLKYLPNTNDMTTDENENINHQVEIMINNFLSAKRVEGCSIKTLKFYKNTLLNIIPTINKELKNITTEDLRNYLDNYSSERKISKVTTDNTRRILSSFLIG